MTADLLKPPDEMRDLVARAAHYADTDVTDGTKRGYASSFRHFRAWAEERGLPFLPSTVETVAVYLAALADGAVTVRWPDPKTGAPKERRTHYKYGSIQHVYQSIIYAHRQAKLDWPTAHPAITKVMRGIAYRNGTKRRKVQPITVEDLRVLLGSLRERRFEDLPVHRNRSILALGFFGAFRRAELTGLRIDDLDFTPEGLVVRVKKSKTDRFSEGTEIGIVAQKDPGLCPIALTKTYLQMSGLKSGPLYRRIDSRSDAIGDKPLTGEAIALILKEIAEACGYDPAQIAGHSLRAGFATTAANRGKSLHNIMRQGRWKNERVAQMYIRPATIFVNNATDGLGDEPEKKR